MDVVAQKPLVEHPVDPPALGVGALILATCLAFFLAFGAVLGTAFLLEQPSASARLASLLHSPGIRTIADADLPQTRMLAAQAEGIDRTATGSIGHAGNSAFGVDLGTAPTLSALRDTWSKHWNTLAASGFAALARVEDVPGGHELRLVAGPFRSSAEASALCEKVAASAPGCAVVPFAGQALAEP